MKIKKINDHNNVKIMMVVVVSVADSITSFKQFAGDNWLQGQSHAPWGAKGGNRQTDDDGYDDYDYDDDYDDDGAGNNNENIYNFFTKIFLVKYLLKYFQCTSLVKLKLAPEFRSVINAMHSVSKTIVVLGWFMSSFFGYRYKMKL